MREIKGHTYLIHRDYEGSRRRDRSIPLDEVDIGTLESALKIKEALLEQTVQFPCMNPNCKNTIPMTRDQIEEFFVSSKKRYNMIVFPVCSDACRDVVLKKHGGVVDDS
ncbi:MAG: hypothetical protein LUQ71_10305 [Methanoregula sp.]|nr:hypothetical protein [Methanoregula sp.]